MNNLTLHWDTSKQSPYQPPASHNFKVNLSMNQGASRGGIMDSERSLGLPVRQSRGQVKGSGIGGEHTSIWDYNNHAEEELAARKRIVMPLKKLIS